MATLAVQQVTRVGAAPTYAAATGGGDACPCGNNIWVQYKNTSGSPITVTFAIVASAIPYPGIAFATESISVPATTGDMVYGPILPQLFQDPTTGMCTITYSGVTNLTVGAFQLATA